MVLILFTISDLLLSRLLEGGLQPPSLNCNETSLALAHESRAWRWQWRNAEHHTWRSGRG